MSNRSSSRTTSPWSPATVWSDVSSTPCVDKSKTLGRQVREQMGAETRAAKAAKDEMVSSNPQPLIAHA